MENVCLQHWQWFKAFGYSFFDVLCWSAKFFHPDNVNYNKYVWYMNWSTQITRFLLFIEYMWFIVYRNNAGMLSNNGLLFLAAPHRISIFHFLLPPLRIARVTQLNSIVSFIVHTFFVCLPSLVYLAWQN